MGSGTGLCYSHRDIALKGNFRREASMRSNCWEFTSCGREPGGKAVDAHGICSAAVNKSYNGANHGFNAGRCCWRAAGTLYGGHCECALLQELGSCDKCEFFQLVKQEEGSDFRA